MSMHYNPDDDERLVAMVREGAMTKEAIGAIGMPGKTLRKRASKITGGRNLQYTVSRLWRPEETAEMLKMLDDGRTIPEISVRLQRSESCVRKYVKKETDPTAYAAMREQRKKSKQNYKLLSASQRLELKPRVCPTCGKTFIPNRNSLLRTFCSPECRAMRRTDDGPYQLPPRTFHCAQCGALVEASGDDKRQKFCSAHCEKLYWKHPRKKEDANAPD